MSKFIRLAAVLALLFSPLWSRPAVAATSGGGPVVLMGIDAEDGGVGGHGPITVYQAVARDIRSKVSNGGSGILVIGGGKSSGDDVTAFWNALGAGIGQSVTYASGTAIGTRSFAGFAIIGVASDINNTPKGGLTQPENNTFAGRQSDIAAFVNNGGGLLGFASDFTNPYAYLGGVGAFTFATGLSYEDITPTASGAAIGITDQLDICCWHDEYARFPGFLSVLATNVETGGAAAIGGANVFISNIQLAPTTASLAVGSAHTLTATIQENGAAVAGKSVTFTVTSGPNVGTTGAATTDSSGRAHFTYVGTRSGTDTVVARYVDSRGNAESSNSATVTWLNQAPSVNAGPDVTGNEGAAIALSGSASDPEGDSLSYAWSYAAISGVDAGATCSFANASAPATTIVCTDDGTYRATLTVSDGVNAAVSNAANVVVRNVAPTASFTTSSQVDEGSAISLALSNPHDPSSNDTAAGFSYAFDCGSGYGSAGSSAMASCATNDNGARTVKARISDKDGGVTEYIAGVSIKNVAPVANFTATSPVNEGDPISLTLSNPSDPSSLDTAAGFSYAFDCDDGNGYQASSSASVVCTTDDNGVRTVKARISDKDGGVSEYTATSTINNVAPQATFTASSQVDEGQTINLALSNASDPSGADTAAGFSYAFDCGSSYGSAGSSATASCATNDNGVRTVKARISDKDGGVSEYTATSTINNVAPQATFTATSPVDEGSAISLALSNPSDPSSVDTAAGFSYAFDCGSGYGSAGSSATASCATNDNGARTVKARISDKDGGVSEYIARVTINNVAPVADFSTSSPVNEGSNFTLTLSNASDPSSVDTAAGFSYAFDCGSGYGSAGSTTTVSCATNDNGTRAVKAKITDKDGGVTEYTDTVVIENVAPQATFSATSPVNEGSNFTLTLSNPSDPSSVDTAAGFSYAFDCNDGYGYRNTNSTPTVDCPTADNGVRVVLAKITDKDGGSSEYVAQVTINNVAPSVGQIIAPLAPNPVGTPITISAPFSDPGTGDTHTAVVDWDDGSTSAGTVSHNEDDLPTIGHVQATHTYTTPGIYTLQVTVTDDDGGEGSSFFQYVVIYDPNGGFVTGGGFINSPAGAYVANPSASGRANFGFNSKYKNGATVPTGQTEFQFKAGNLNFHSQSYEWLVVAGARAQYKGVGTINGSGNYGFMLTVIDGQINGGGGVDKFRIKIWDKSNADAVVYDNQMGGATDADPTMAIQSGSIVIHKGD